MTRTALGLFSDWESCLRAIAAYSWIPQPARDAISLIQDKQFDKAQAALSEAIPTAKSQREKCCLNALYAIALAGNDSSAIQYLPHSGISHYLCI